MRFLKIEKHKTEAMSMNVVKSMIFRFIEVYYNRKRIYTTNVSYPPLIKRLNYYKDLLAKAG